MLGQPGVRRSLLVQTIKKSTINSMLKQTVQRVDPQLFKLLKH
jgi:hypothetical protein